MKTIIKLISVCPAFYFIFFSFEKHLQTYIFIIVVFVIMNIVQFYTGLYIQNTHKIEFNYFKLRWSRVCRVKLVFSFWGVIGGDEFVAIKVRRFSWIITHAVFWAAVRRGTFLWRRCSSLLRWLTIDRNWQDCGKGLFLLSSKFHLQLH